MKIWFIVDLHSMIGFTLYTYRGNHVFYLIVVNPLDVVVFDSALFSDAIDQLLVKKSEGVDFDSLLRDVTK